jgi:hypothetical protein
MYILHRYVRNAVFRVVDPTPGGTHIHARTHDCSQDLMRLRRTPSAEVLEARTRLGMNPLGGLMAEDGVRREHYALNSPLLCRGVRRDATLLTYH